MGFTLEEVNLLWIFDTGIRTATIDNLNAALPLYDEPELRAITEKLLVKLSDMTDAEFSALELIPEFDESED
jgi:hypothetical protein